MTDNVWISDLETAWKLHISQSIQTPKWIEDSTEISEIVRLSKRELLGLVVLAASQNLLNSKWQVGYNRSDPEPNDGFITDGTAKFHVEHKLVAQMDERKIATALTETYDKYSLKGSAYGAGRLLIVHANQQSQGLVKVSDLKHHIGELSPFDAVFLLHGINLLAKSDYFCFQIHQFYPKLKKTTDDGLAQIEIEVQTGRTLIPHSGIRLIHNTI